MVNPRLILRWLSMAGVKRLAAISSDRGRSVVDWSLGFLAGQENRLFFIFLLRYLVISSHPTTPLSPKRRGELVYRRENHASQASLNEYGFRYNHRKDEKPMFKTVLEKI